MFSRDVLHLWVLTAALVALGMGYFGVRSFAVPPSFGERGHYRGDALREDAALPIRAATRAACLQCHEKTWAGKDESAHAKVHCSSCHGQATEHVRSCTAALAAAKAKGADPASLQCEHEGLEPKHLRKTCETCHMQMVGRPAKFVQIVPDVHLEEQEAKEPKSPKACAQCHQAHDPGEEPEQEGEAEEAEEADEAADAEGDEAAPAEAAAGATAESAAPAPTEPAAPAPTQPEAPAGATK